MVSTDDRLLEIIVKAAADWLIQQDIGYEQAPGHAYWLARNILMIGQEAYKEALRTERLTNAPSSCKMH